MPAPVSRVPTARAALYAAIDLQPSVTAPVQLVYDGPGPRRQDDVISVEAPTRTLDRYALVGGGGQYAFSEEFTIPVIVDCYRGGDTAQTVFERACALADEVVEAVRADLTLGGTVLTATFGEVIYDAGWENDNKGRGCRITVPVRCTAVL